VRIMTAQAQQFEKWLKENCKDYGGGQAEKIISEKVCPGDLFELGKAVLYSFEPFLKWCINALNKITGAKK